MKILILNPPNENTLSEFSDEKSDEYIETDDFGKFPPLGALYVLSYLEQYTRGHDLFFKDCVAENVTHSGLRDYIDLIRPDVVGITSFTHSLIDVMMSAKTVRELNPAVHLCLGGHHPIAFPFEAAQLKEFDTIVVGEGEIAFTQLINAIEQKKIYTDIRGVYTKDTIKKCKGNEYKKDSRFLHKVCVPPAYIEDINSIPPPNREYIKHINYQSIVGVSSRLATMISSRGCPFRCTFCDVPLKQYRKRDIKLVVDEIEFCLKMGYDEMHFYDDLFNITPERVIQFCDEIKRRDLRFKWDFRGRVDRVTFNSLKRFKEAGGRMISFGIETGTDEGLKELKKGFKSEQAREVLKWCRDLGIITIADYMIGLPSEKSAQDIKANINQLITYDPDYAQFAILSLYPNTEIYEQAIRKGLIKSGKWNEWVMDPSADFEIDHWNEFLSTPDLVRLQRLAYRKFYLRPKIIFRSLLRITSFYELKTKIRGALKVIGIRFNVKIF